MNYQEEKKYIGHRDQLIRVRRIRMQEGKAQGVELLDVQNRSGMHFDVNISLFSDFHFFVESPLFRKVTYPVDIGWFQVFVSEKYFSRIRGCNLIDNSN